MPGEIGETRRTPPSRKDQFLPPHAIIVDNMVVDPAVQQALVARILAAGLPDRPAETAARLGPVDLPDGTRRGLFVRFAADGVLADRAGNIVLITRLHNPGIGRLAIPGGFVDLVNGQPEDIVTTARRELAEETGIDAALLRDAALAGIGWRRYNRPFDLRIAWSDIPDTDIKKGDIFMASTQPIYLRTDADLTRTRLTAGDDATAARVVSAATITADTLGIPDQLGMIAEMP
jgi:8-oxo-dGTP pyrophosphatase MutT (NUDIX family)